MQPVPPRHATAPLALVAVLLAGLILQVTGSLRLSADLASPVPDAPPVASTAVHDPVVATAPAAAFGSGSGFGFIFGSGAGVVGTTAAWRLALARMATALAALPTLALVLVLAAAAAAGRRSPAGAWLLVRPDRALPTARHGSPLAARRGPPAPAAC